MDKDARKKFKSPLISIFSPGGRGRCEKIELMDQTGRMGELEKL
jgi:hypothetical protein